MKSYTLFAQNPSTKEWVALHSVTTTASLSHVKTRKESQEAVRKANETHKNWPLEWRVEG